MLMHQFQIIATYYFSYSVYNEAKIAGQNFNGNKIKSTFIIKDKSVSTDAITGLVNGLHWSGQKVRSEGSRLGCECEG